MAKFINYDEVADAQFLTLYLQFLTRCHFFENQKDKAGLFVALHTEIEACVGGMLTRLEQYIGNNVIAENILAEIKKKVGAQNDARITQDVHVLALFKKFLLGIETTDPHAVSVAKYIPHELLTELCSQALSGDFFDEALTLEVRNFIQAMIEMKDEDVQKMFGSFKDFGFYTENNRAIRNLTAMGKTILVGITDQRKYIDLSALAEFSEFQADIVFDSNTYEPNDFKSRQKAVARLMQEKGFTSKAQLVDYYTKKSLEEIKDRIQKIAAEMPDEKRKTGLVTEETKKKLAKLGIVEALFLTPASFVTLNEAQFLEYCDELCDYSQDQQQVRDNASYIPKIKSEIARYLPENILQFIDEKLSLLRVKTYQYQDARTGAMKESKTLSTAPKSVIAPLVDVLKKNEVAQDIVAACNRGFFVQSDQKVTISFIDFTVLLENNLLGAVPPGKLAVVMHQNLKPESFINMQQFWDLLDQYEVNIEGGNFYVDELKSLAALLTFLGNHYGEALIHNDPEKYYQLLSKAIDSGKMQYLARELSTFFSSNAAKTLLEKNPQKYFETLLGLEEVYTDNQDVLKAMLGAHGRRLMETNPALFLRLTFVLDSVSYKIFSIGDIARDAVARHGNQVIESLKNTRKKDHVVEFLQERNGQTLLRNNPSRIIEILSSLSIPGSSLGKKEMLKILNSASVKELSDADFAIFTSQLSQSQNSELHSAALISGVGQRLLKQNPQQFSTLSQHIASEDLVNFLESDTAKEFLKYDASQYVRLLVASQPTTIFAACMGDVGAYLATHHPQLFLDIVSSSVRSQSESRVSSVLQSQAGAILIEKLPNETAGLLLSLDNKFLGGFLGGQNAKILLEKSPEKYLEILKEAKKADEKSWVSMAMTGACGQILAARYPSEFIDLFPLLDHPFYIGFTLNSNSGKTFLRNIFKLDQTIDFKVSEKDGKIEISDLPAKEFERVKKDFASCTKTEGKIMTTSIEKLAEMVKGVKNPSVNPSTNPRQTTASQTSEDDYKLVYGAGCNIL